MSNMDATEQNKHLAWAERLCSRREYCVFDLRTKLKTRSVSSQEAEQVIEALIQQNFLNDERYTRAFVQDKSNLQGWGPEKIRYALRVKQIPDTLIREALAGIDSHAQKETLFRLLETKRRNLKAASDIDARNKLIRFAQSRGFTYEDVASALKIGR